MPAAMPILDVAHDLMNDPAARADLNADPDGFLAARGLDGLTGEELVEAMEHVGDALPAAEAAQLASAEDLAAMADGPSGPAALFGELAEVRTTEGDVGDLGPDVGEGHDLHHDEVDGEAVPENAPEEEADDAFDVDPFEAVEADEFTSLDERVDDHHSGELHDHLEGHLDHGAGTQEGYLDGVFDDHLGLDGAGG